MQNKRNLYLIKNELSEEFKPQLSTQIREQEIQKRILNRVDDLIESLIKKAQDGDIEVFKLLFDMARI